MRTALRTIGISTLGFLVPLAAQGPPLGQKDMGVRVSVEEIQMPEHPERMGLLGVSVFRYATPQLTFGASLYGAVRGKRGGFLTAGLDAGYHHPLGEKLSLDAGLFLGAGGGDPGYNYGNGLMLRPSLGLSWAVEGNRLGLEASVLRFPTGAIHSSQIAFTWTSRFTTLGFDGQPRAFVPKGEPLLGARFLPGFFEITSQHYTHPGGLYSMKGRNETPSPAMLGFTVGLGSDPRRFWLVEGSASYGGNAENYNEFLVGYGGRIGLDAGGRTSLRGTLSAGSGGGRTLGAGGGFILKAGAMVQVKVNREVYLGLEVGQFAAPSTSLRATTLALRFGFDFRLAQPTSGDSGLESPGAFDLASWQFRPTYAYFTRSQRAYEGLRDSPVGMVGFAIDSLKSDWLYLTAQIMMAAQGTAGSWGTGLVGVGLQTPTFGGGRHRLVSEWLVGATAGGGLDIQGGAAAQVMGGWSMEISPAWGFQLMGGRLKTFRGRFDTPIFSASLVYRGATLFRR